MKKSVGSQSNLPLNNSSMNSIKSTNNSNNSIHHSLGKIRTLSNTSFQSNEDGRENNISSSNQSLNISTTNISASTNTCISPIGPDGRLKLQESQREELRDLIQGQKLAQNDVDIEMTSYHNHEINEKTKFDSVASLTNEKNEQFNTTSNLMATVTAISPTMIMPTVSLSEPQYVFSQPSNLLLPEKYSSMDFLPLQPQIKEDDGQEVNSSIHPSIPVNLNEHQRIHLSELELELQQQRHLEEVQQTLQKIALSQKGPHIDFLDCRFMAEDMSELTTCAGMI